MAHQPDTYTHGHQAAVLRAHRWRTAENSAAYLLPALRRGLSLLDVGCGPGTLTADLARRLAPGPVTGIDVAAAVVEQAALDAGAAGVDNLAYVAGDFRTADLPGPFDVVHCHQVLQHLREPAGALERMAELARPGGGLVAAREADYSAMSWAPADERIQRWLDIYLAVTRRNGAEPNAGRWLPRWARTAGLADVTYTTSTWTFATPADRAYWGGQWSERVVASTFAEQAVDYGIATRSELAAIAEGWRDWTREPDGVFVVVHGEIIGRV